MELNVLQWPSVPFAACYISQKRFSLLSFEYKKMSVGKFNWGCWIRLCCPNIEYLARCYPSTDLSLHEQIYASIDNLVSISNAICIKNITNGELKNPIDANLVTNEYVSASFMEPIPPADIVDCVNITLSLCSPNIFLAIEVKESRKSVSIL